MDRKSKLKFKGRKHSKKGIAAMVLALFALAGFIAASVISAYAKGQAGILVGYMGIGCFIVSVVGFALGVRSLREPDILYFQPVFGVAVNGLLMLALVSLYLTGLLL